MSARQLTVLATAAAAIALSGCSSSGGGGAKVALADVPLQATDLPSSYTSKAHDPADDSDDAAERKAFIACVGGSFRDTSSSKVREIHSKTFAASSKDASIDSSATLYKSSDDIANDTKLFADSKAGPCFEAQARKQLATSLPEGADIGTLKVSLEPGNGGGPKNVVATLTASVPLTAEGKTVTVYIDSVFIAGDKVEAEVGFTGFGKRVDEAVRTKAIAAVAGRAANA